MPAGPRLPLLSPDRLEADQTAVYQEITGGPRATGPQPFPLTDPDGGLPHDTTNCSIADLTLSLTVAGGRERTLVATGTATYELGGRDQPDQIAIEPYGAL